MARNMTHITASLTATAFDQLRSKDEATQSAARRTIERMQAVNKGLDQQWAILARLTGQQQQEHLAEELDLTGVRVHKASVTPEPRN